MFENNVPLPAKLARGHKNRSSFDSVISGGNAEPLSEPSLKVGKT